MSFIKKLFGGATKEKKETPYRDTYKYRIRLHSETIGGAIRWFGKAEYNWNYKKDPQWSIWRNVRPDLVLQDKDKECLLEALNKQIEEHKATERSRVTIPVE